MPASLSLSIHFLFARLSWFSLNTGNKVCISCPTFSTSKHKLNDLDLLQILACFSLSQSYSHRGQGSLQGSDWTLPTIPEVWKPSPATTMDFLFFFLTSWSPPPPSNASLGLAEYIHRSVFPEWLLDCRKNTVPNIPMTILSEPALSLALMVRKECLFSFTSAFKVSLIPSQGTSICTAGLPSVAPCGSPVPCC